MYASKYDLALIEAARGGDRQAIVTLLAVAQPDITTLCAAQLQRGR